MGSSETIRNLKLRILTIQAHIHSDTAGFIEFFSDMYQRFLVNKFEPSLVQPLEFNFFKSSANPWGYPLLSFNGEIWPTNQLVNLESYAYDGILSTILAHVDTHFLIHAGVLARNNQGVLLVADSGHGKTTLVLALVRRGFLFLSDELAPLSRDGKEVQPFPRSLRVRPGTLELAGLNIPVENEPLWFDKHILDIEEIQPGCLGKATNLSKVIILKDRNGEKINQESENELGIFLSRLDPDLVELTSRFEGITSAWQTIELGYPVLRIRSKQRMRALAQIEGLCKERNILILDISKRPLLKPDFNSPAHLDPIPRSQAVMELVRQFQPGHKSRLLRELGGPTKLYLGLARVIDQVECYQLSPGPLQEMVELVDVISG